MNTVYSNVTIQGSTMSNANAGTFTLQPGTTYHVTSPIVSLSGGGVGGYGYGVSNIQWTGNSAVWNNTSIVDDTEIKPSSLQVKGDADIQGDLKIQGKSLMDRISKIEDRLAILQFNPRLEEKWENLKSLGDQYRELEKDILEKEEIWAKLKA